MPGGKLDYECQGEGNMSGELFQSPTMYKTLHINSFLYVFMLNITLLNIVCM